ncbi:hypothetical protein [Poseidonibacter ostreae]|uniref:Uncharacterized protein n=1 Tax=Poseidonibacter ostreae TaxID=2654171 RepID=A0A6L4WX31_9BACT|nr:hypothetical protein [Poseidonibacter ostreae]KAB7891405.1 hypothetical protein GBG19_00785 [Poseidonibacter ostreae]
MKRITLTEDEKKTLEEICNKVDCNSLTIEDLIDIKSKSLLKAICIENFGGIFKGSSATIRAKIIASADSQK